MKKNVSPYGGRVSKTACRRCKRRSVAVHPHRERVVRTRINSPHTCLHPISGTDESLTLSLEGLKDEN